jgi:hypothetical protein
VPSPASDARRLLPAAVLAVLVLVGIGSCDLGGSGSPPRSPSAAPTPTTSSTPLAQMDTSQVIVARAGFCDRVSPTAVEAAVGSHEYDDTSYSNGDRARLAGGLSDVAHEYSCTWTAQDGSRAQAWVFAPPVTPVQARHLVRGELRPGCSRADTSAGFGAPSVATSCAGRVSGAGTELGYHGLFGDAWLSCTLTAPKGPAPDDLPQRADHWCAAVLQAASA